ncbi:inositol monophosphatase family protein [Pseudogracilibacillus sp. SO30301A]|uniref:inositol monophosphatase family protein n=1 Tax=Pseudogracilibacillus sp. SO30301A TaxID=3098291 RepID=UPI00300E5A2F
MLTKEMVINFQVYSRVKELIQQAGETVRNEVFHRETITTKESFIDLVTTVAQEVEIFFTKKLRRLIPGSHLIAEKSNTMNSLDFSKFEYTWIISPIEGTKNRFATSIALYNYNEIKFGITLDIPNNFLYAAQKDQGAFINDIPLTVSSVDSLKNSLIANPLLTTEWNDHAQFNNIPHSFFNKSHGIRNSGSSSLDLALIASGQMDGFWHQNLQPWDVAAGIILVEEAGGKATNLYVDKSNIIVVSNKTIHEQLVNHIKNNVKRCH